MVVLVCLLLLAGFLQFRDSSRRVKTAWLVVAGLLAVPLFLVVWVYTAIDWSPTIAPAEVTGRWSDRDRTLDLLSDGTYLTAGRAGRWRILRGSALELAPEPAGFVEPHFFRWKGELHIRPVTTDDDGIDNLRYPDLGMTKESR